MIRKIAIENYKSIEKVELELGRINVFIGENGSGKSNVLEAIAFASAASQDKLDNEFLASRGIRVTEPRFMRAAFEAGQETRPIHIVIDDDVRFEYKLKSEGSTGHVRWVNEVGVKLTPEYLDRLTEEMVRRFKAVAKTTGPDAAAALGPALKGAVSHLEPVEWVQEFILARLAHTADPSLRSFLVYSPENTALRIFQAEGQILPLGIKGEGLFAHLKALTAEPDRTTLTAITERLSLLDWFERFEIPEDLAPGERSLRVRDRYLAEGALFDQRSANEGFLFLLFYFTLFLSPDTPAFFAVDNIDASLNPKLCSALTEGLAIWRPGTASRPSSPPTTPPSSTASTSTTTSSASWSCTQQERPHQGAARPAAPAHRGGAAGPALGGVPARVHRRPAEELLTGPGARLGELC